MKFKKLAVTTVLLAAMVSTSAMAADGRYVILMNGKSASKNLAAKIEKAGGTLVRTIPQVNIAIATSSNDSFVSNAKSIKGVADAGPVGARGVPMTQMPVRFSETTEPALTGPTANDDLFYQKFLWGIDRIHAPEAWAAGNTGSHDTVVAIIDTGIASNHPDLAPNLLYEACFDSEGDTCDPYPHYSGHGTHVAGTVAAAFDAGRVVGVGPNLGLANYNVFEPIEGCGNCAYSDSRWMAMIDAADNGFEVINMSLGGLAKFGGQGTNGLSAYVQAEKKVAAYVRKAGTIMIAASGNDGLWTNGSLIHLPSDIPSIVGVAATGIQPFPEYPFPGSYDIRAFYSNFGAASTISAPGGDCGEISTCSGGTPWPYYWGFILSTGVDPEFPEGCADTASCEIFYSFSAGTSMASPHVAGVAGLIADKYPGISPQEITDILKSTADKVGNRQEFGHGVVDAHAATQ